MKLRILKEFIMKDKTKGKLLKTKGIIKKICAWFPVAMIAGGFIGFTGMFEGGLFMATGAKKEFKNTEIFAEAYSEKYEESLYKSGEMNVYTYNNKMEYLESDKFVKDVMNEAGEAAEPYIEKKKIGTAVASCSVLQVAAIFGGMGLIFRGTIGNITESAEDDLEEAKRLLAPYVPPVVPPPTKTNKNNASELEEDEEELPSIDDDYYK